MNYVDSASLVYQKETTLAPSSCTAVGSWALRMWVMVTVPTRSVVMSLLAGFLECLRVVFRPIRAVQGPEFVFARHATPKTTAS